MAKVKKKKPKPRKKKSTLSNQFHGMLAADGFDDAVVGHTVAQPGRPALIVYQYERCIHILMERDGMEYAEAVEFMDFNVVGSWVGEGTPVFIINRHQEF
jgi:hypothetical protein